MAVSNPNRSNGAMSNNSSMENRLIEVENMVNSISTRTTEIYQLLAGNPMDPSTGFIHKQKDLSNRIDNLDIDVKRSQIKIDKVEHLEKQIDNLQTTIDELVKQRDSIKMVMYVLSAVSTIGATGGIEVLFQLLKKVF